MSEGPEVRRTADVLADALVGRQVESLELRSRAGIPEALRRRILGSRVSDVRTYGKHLVLVFGEAAYLHNHMMMWGKWRVYDREKYDGGRAVPPPRIARGPLVGPTVRDVRKDSRVRLVIATHKTVAVEFNGPILRFSDTDPALGAGITRLGPDALKRPFPESHVRRRLARRAAMTLADLLLDQSFVAGIGNKYKSEILFLNGLNPFMRARELDARAIQRLLRSMPRVLRHGYLHGGWTREPRPGDTGGRWAVGHWVFRRSGRPCHVCGTAVATDRASSSRVTYLCPNCQRA